MSLDFPDAAIEQIPEALTAYNVRHRLVTWGYFPFLMHSAASYSVELRSGFPFSPLDSYGRLAGPFNGLSMPVFFSTNFSIEKEIPFVLGKRMAVRVTATNLFNRFNPSFVDSNVDSPTFLHFGDSTGRAFAGRVRILKK